MKNGLLILLFFSSFSASISLAASNSLQVRHYQSHPRYEYGAQLLDLALSKANINYQINTLKNRVINEARGELQVISGQLDLQWMSTSTDRENDMIAIKIPIYQGILGLRLLLVNKTRSTEFEKLTTLTGLGQYTAGHGLHWQDLPVYNANALKVFPHKNYESIFTLLKLNRIDYFHRGLSEIWGELERHSDTLAVADKVMLFYPHPVYFFVSKHKPELAQSLQKGLVVALEDGSFKALFLRHMGKFIELGKLSERRVLVLENPVLPPNTLEIKTDWWSPEYLRKELDKQN